MEDISAVVIARNEVKRIPELMESLRGIDDIVIVDNGSSDGTAALATKLGARVFCMGETFTDTRADADDVARFTDRFGWEPSFHAGTKFFSPSNARNFGASKARNDWIFNPDADETVKWDLDKVRALLPDNDQIGFKFIHTDGQEFHQHKLYRRTALVYMGRIHEVVIPLQPNPRRAFCDDMVLVHHQEPKPYRSTALGCLEYAVVTESYERNIFYLAREYASAARYDESLRMFDEYLSVATWAPEIAESHFIRAQVYLVQKRIGEARASLLMAIGTNPEFSEALRYMAALSSAHEAVAWNRYAASATDEGTLFVRTPMLRPEKAVRDQGTTAVR